LKKDAAHAILGAEQMSGGEVLDPIKILIADGNETFRNSLLQGLDGMYQIYTCQDGQEALHLLQTLQPDILITELLLRKLDGLSVIHEAGALPHPPLVLVVTSFISDYVKSALESTSVKGVILKPGTNDAIQAHIHQIAQSIQPFYSQRSERFISDILRQLEIPPHRDGYTQLKAVIPMYADNPAQPLNKVIYAKAAQKCGFTGPKQVEHSIRTAICATWEAHTNPLWDQLFPQGRPSNKVFISRIASALCDHLLCGSTPVGE
jgi:CheY-like chemotaxis protein